MQAQAKPVQSQATPRCWNQRFADFMKQQTLKVNTVDPCLFVRQHNGKKLIVAIYVDDGFITGSGESEIDQCVF